MTSKYMFLDIEATGLDPLRNNVLTLAAYITDDSYQLMDELFLQVRPDGSRKVSWSEEAEKAHGITWDEAMTYPDSKEQAGVFGAFLSKHEGAIIVAHNAPYDRRMIKGWLFKSNDNYHDHYKMRTWDDTMRMLKKTKLIKGKSYSLGPVCQELDIEHNHHDARSDAFVLIEIHRRIMEANMNAGMSPVFDNLDSTPSESLPQETFV